ncbi:MAG: hypothetical protein VX436_01230, partial [Planctomycetota bacterium]|nr:hypothetical protein [Planctomycetota bacterium]
MRHLHVIIATSAFFCQSQVLGSQSASEPESSVEILAGERLGEEFLRVAHMAAMSEPLNTKTITAAVTLITEASKLMPDDEAVWQSMIEVAQMADRPELQSYAIKELLRITPTASSPQLSRLRDVVATTNTVDERMAVYEQLLSDGRSSKLDSRVAAKLSFDAAMLQRQLGDTEQFARWLAESIALDPSNPEAMSLAAGFFGDESADAHRRAELLASAVFSNIRDITNQVALAEFLLAYGDYKDARAMYEIVLMGNEGNIESISDGLLADIVLSQWADGDPIAALDTLLTRQIYVDNIFRLQTKSQQPRLTPLQLSRIHAPLLPKLATVRAAIYASQGDDSKAKIAYEDAGDSFEAIISIYQTQGEAALDQLVNLLLQAAWISVWIGEEAEVARSIINNVEERATIGDREKNRLEGWIAMLNGDLDTAITHLSKFSDDNAARAGLAKVYLLQGNTQAAAREYLSVARSQSGTLLGVWSRNQLRNIVGQDFPIRSEIEQLQLFMGGVLQTLNSFIHDPRPAIEVRIKPEKEVFSPYEPMNIRVELTNNTSLPLTVSKAGPVQPLLLMEAFIEVPDASITQTPPIIIPVNREVSIKPRTSLTFHTNLRQKWVGGLFNEFPLRGATMRLRATINFTARETTDRRGAPVLVYGTGRLGCSEETDIFRINGVRLTDTWLKEAISQAAVVDTINDLTSLLLLTHVVDDSVVIRVEEPEIPVNVDVEPVAPLQGERLSIQDEAITTVLTTFP